MPKPLIGPKALQRYENSAKSPNFFHFPFANHFYYHIDASYQSTGFGNQVGDFMDAKFHHKTFSVGLHGTLANTKCLGNIECRQPFGK